MLRILVFLFVVSTSFDAFTFPFFRPTDTFSRVIGIILFTLFLAWLPALKPSARLFSRELRWFYLFAAVTAVEEVFLLNFMFPQQGEFRGYLAYLQLFALMFILQDLTRDVRIYKAVVVAVLMSYTTMSILTTFNVGIVTYTDTPSVIRVGVVGINLNQLAYFYAVIAVCIVSWLLAEGNLQSVSGFAKLGVLCFLILGIARSGSRAGAVAFVVGFLVTSFVNIRVKRVSRYFLLMPVLVAGLSYFLLEHGAVLERMTRTIEYGDTGYRDKLLEEGLDLARQSPIVGYGTMYGRVLGPAVGFKNIAAHDTYLQIILSFGILGLVPFLLGSCTLVRLLWRRRDSVWGGMWFSVLVMTLVFGFAGHFGDNKVFWILLVLLANVDVVEHRWASCCSPARLRSGGQGRVLKELA